MTMYAVMTLSCMMASTAPHTCSSMYRTTRNQRYLMAIPRLSIKSRSHSRIESVSKLQASSSDDFNGSLQPPQPRPNDYLLLALVPLVWGTYSPLVSFVYSGEVAPPPLIFNALSFVVSFASLSLASSVTTPSPVETTDDTSQRRRRTLVAGAELGLWLFLGSTVQLQGLQLTSPTKAAVLVQTTTVIVPLLESALSSKQLPVSSYLSCLLAAVGIAVLSLGDSLTPALNLAFERGDALVLLSAVFYSLHVVRLGSLAPSLDAVDLSRMKSATELALCTISIAVLTALGIREYSAYASTVVTAAAASPAAVLPVIAAVVWNGLAATALTTWAQSRGQRAVGPTTANLIYSSQPLWSAAFAFLFLHETLSTRGWIGSAVLMVAIVYGAIGVNGNAIKTKTENFVIDS